MSEMFYRKVCQEYEKMLETAKCTSFKVRVPEQPGNLEGWLYMISTTPSSSNTPCFTNLKLRICAPSCQIVLEKGGIDPARMPPIFFDQWQEETRRGKHTNIGVMCTRGCPENDLAVVECRGHYGYIRQMGASCVCMIHSQLVTINRVTFWHAWMVRD